MSELQRYIKQTKEYSKKHNLTTEELVRYVFLDFGKRFSFDVSFAFVNTKKRGEIYARSTK